MRSWFERHQVAGDGPLAGPLVDGGGMGDEESRRRGSDLDMVPRVG
jgi:hypothetical protein